MKKLSLLTLCLMSAFVCLAQTDTPASETVTCGPFLSIGEEKGLNVHDIIWNKNQKVVDSNWNHAVTRSASDVGVRWIDRIRNMPDYLLDFYKEYGDRVHEALDGTPNWTTDPSLGIYLNNLGSYTTIKLFQGSLDFEFPANSSKTVIGNAASQAMFVESSKIWNEANCFLNYLIICLSLDYPEAFWLSNYFRWGYFSSYTYKYSPSGGTGTISYDLTLYYLLKNNEFDRRLDVLQDAQLVHSSIQEYNEKTDKILKNTPTDSRYDQVLYFNNWLTMHNCYNSIYNSHPANISDIVWSPLSALRESTGKTGPVCEAYARAFKIFCDRQNIPCVLQYGFAKGSRYATGESHMWNEVKMDDGNWYAVDVTWDDPIVNNNNNKISGNENTFWLLIGKYDLVGDNFTFEESHPASIVWEYNPEYEDVWDFDVFSLITDYRYQPGTAIETLQNDLTGSPLKVYNLKGQHLGTFRSVKEISPCFRNQLLLVNGKKMFISH